MRERPILFSDPMVIAIRNKTKRVTRRVITEKWLKHHRLNLDTEEGRNRAIDLCPYGHVGDRLWVKEAFSLDHAKFYPHWPIIYRADGYDPRDPTEKLKSQVFSPEAQRYFPFKWKPSIFMNRCYSRNLLEITDVRPEPLHDMNEEEAFLEGFRPRETNYGHGVPTALTEFRALWEKLNSEVHRGYGWRTNPWVFRVAFNPIELK